MSERKAHWTRVIDYWEGTFMGAILGFAACGWLLAADRLNKHNAGLWLDVVAAVCVVSGITPRLIASMVAGVKRYRAAARGDRPPNR